MTNNAPNAMPDEIWVTMNENKSLIPMYVPFEGNDGRLSKPVKYIRTDLAPTSQWRDITEPMPYGNYIVTNNPTARLNNGSMSHCWHTNMVHWDEKEKEFTCFYGMNMAKIHGLKMYMDVPLPSPPTKDLAAAGKEKV